ncbi:hypothetical protein PMAYCL1PPCAC_29370, partial [Pristionchus mayeri]
GGIILSLSLSLSLPLILLVIIHTMLSSLFFSLLATTYVSSTQTLSHQFGVHNEVHDEAHLKEHLEDKIDISKMSDEQQKFYYFSMHDLNKDNMIDGIEIMKALAHDHESGKSGPGVAVNDEEGMIKMVDVVLNDSDYNGDGFIDYAEYIKKQKEQ